MLQFETALSSLTIIIYDCNLFIVQSTGHHYKSRLLALPVKIIFGLKGLTVRNRLVYYDTELMEQHVFCIFINYRGHHRKSVEIYNAT